MMDLTKENAQRVSNEHCHRGLLNDSASVEIAQRQEKAQLVARICKTDENMYHTVFVR